MADRAGGRRRRVLMQDVAEAAGVSKTTVSRVLNGTGTGIPEETRQRVVTVSDDLGYRPNAIASGLRRRTSDTIGFISDVIASTPNAGAMVQGAQDAAWDAGKVLVLVNTGGDPQVEDKAIETMLRRQVDGLIYATMYHQLVDPPVALGAVPCVLLDARSAAGSLSGVTPDEAGGAGTAIRYLLGLGHRRVGFVNSGADIPAARERRAGYEAALAAAGIVPDPQLQVADIDEFEGGVRGARALLEGAERPTALFCFNDRMAAGAIRAARELGLSVPHEVSVVGFDNQELVALLTDPPLTTLQLPHYAMGRWAVSTLLERLGPGGDPSVVEHRIACELVVRQSAAPPRLAEPAVSGRP